MPDNDIVGLVIDDKYRLDRMIGEGGMGAVYLGVQLMVDRNVAIKVLHSGLNAHDRIKQRFEVEAKAIGRLHHPNCITLYDFGYSTALDAFYMVMEYLDGQPMHKAVLEGVLVKDAVDIVRQIAMALDHAHHQKILHRDLKPENVMLTTMTDGSRLVKVLDFGIARIFQGSEDENQPSAQQQNRLTKAGEVFGTPAYISPEQARGERNLNPSSDLYSLGIMLFEMLQGELPFWGETAIDTIMKHITSPIPQINRLDVPAPLKQLTYQLLDKDPAKRPQSGRELVERLQAIEQMMERQPVGVAAGMAYGHAGPLSAAPPQSSSMSQEIPLGAGVGMSRADMNEWSSAEATRVTGPDRTGEFVNTIPEMSFGAEPAFSNHTPQQPSRPPVMTPTGSGMYNRPHTPTTGASSSTSSLLQTHPELFKTEPEIGKKKSPLPLILIALLGLCLVGAGAAFVLLQGDNATDAPEASTPTVAQEKPAPKPTTEPAVAPAEDKDEANEASPAVKKDGGEDTAPEEPGKKPANKAAKKATKKPAKADKQRGAQKPAKAAAKPDDPPKADPVEEPKKTPAKKPAKKPKSIDLDAGTKKTTSPDSLPLPGL